MNSSIRDGMIYTAGPSITQKEIDFVTDAIHNCIDEKAWSYVSLMEQKMEKLIGAKRAYATSSCTGALHLIGWGLGIAPGDEVIVPDMSWIASVSPYVQLGATPVYVDIEEDTWCISPKAVEAAITGKTKAIVVTDMFGHPADFDSINELAQQHNITVIEDSAPAIGSMYKGQMAGNLGTAGAFSFHGAKITGAGEGGMICTNDEELSERIAQIANHGRDLSKHLYSVRWGCKYNISNLQAAMACAQLDRLEELLAKKKQNFDWYIEEFSDIDGLRWNTERPDCKTNFSTIAVVMENDFGIDRNDVIEGLKEVNVDSRPFFYATSTLPMVNQDLSKENPVSYRVAAHGLNLPNRHDLEQEDVAYISKHLKRILRVK